MEKKRPFYVILLLITIVAACILYQSIPKAPAETNQRHEITTTTLPAVVFRSPQAYGEAIQRDRLIDHYTKEEYYPGNGTGYYEYTGTRKSVIGVMEYSETLKVRVDNITGEIIQTELISREAPACAADSDCCATGLNNESLPCYALASCACLDGRCALIENQGFQKCVVESEAEYAMRPAP
ncbi:MAG: hypothetical protein WAX07_07525 [Candidatus Altiarchaeia archaeon]